MAPQSPLGPFPTFDRQLPFLNAAQKEVLKKIPHFENIDGWILSSEAVELYRLSMEIQSVHPIICEIGSWKGKSTYIFATAMEEKKGIVYAIDPFTGEGDVASIDTYQFEMKNLGTSLLTNFKDTLSKYKIEKHVTIMPTTSENAHPHFPESKIDLLFIDGNHDYHEVKKDFELWTPLLMSGATLVLHDVKALHVDGPRRVMQEYLIRNPLWKNIYFVGQMAVATKV